MMHIENYIKNKVVSFVLFFFYLLLVSINYSEIISPIYIEMDAIDFVSVDYWAKLILITSVFSITLGNEIKRPSQLVFLIIFLFIITPTIIVAPYLHYRYQYYEVLTCYIVLFYILSWSVTSLSSLFIKDIVLFRQKNKLSYEGNLVKFLAFVTVITTFYVLYKGYSTFDLSVSDYSLRRLNGRELFPGGAITSYIVSVVNSAIVLLLISYSVIYRKVFYLVVSAVYVIVDWGVFGTKITFILSIMTFFTMLHYSLGRRLTVTLFLIPMLLLLMLSCFLYYFYDNEVFADITIRRIVIVPAIISQAYADYISHTSPTLYADTGLYRFFGQVIERPTYIIGEQYFGKPDMNSNTNLIIMEVVRLGDIGVLLAFWVISFILIVLDRLYSRNYNPIYIIIALLFGVRITEQALTTLLLSSGVTIMILIAFVLDRKSKVIQHTRVEI